MNIHDKINIRALAREFPIIGEKEMRERFRKLKIGSTGDLMNQMQFRGEVLIDGVMIEIDYLWYGRFTDAGVGNGITQDDVRISKLLGFTRKRKNWTRALAGFRWRLGELYAQAVVDDISQQMNGSYDRTIRMRF